jgi:Cd2+/Zn2+-exporting ATPase
VFDKTGTLTTGELGVTRLAPADGVKPSELLFAAGSAEQFSKHPAALALVALAKETGLALVEPQDFREEPGQGLTATVAGNRIVTGRAAWLKTNGITVADVDAEGASVIFVAQNGRLLGWIGLQDQVRADAAPALKELAELSIKRLAMVTGDRAPVAARVANEIGCREFQAECLPQQKVDFVNAVKRDGYRVAVVGDGVNDAPALAAGDTGIAMGAAGSDVAIHSATIALMSNDLRRLPFLVKLSRGARGVIHQNLSVAGLFIFGGLTLAGLGLLNPIVAAVLHNVGAIIVVFNSARLIRAGEELTQPTQLPPKEEGVSFSP